MLSVSAPKEPRMKRPNIINRNWLACVLSDVVFVPFAERGTKTLALARQLLTAQIPIFTSDHEDNKALHQLGISGLSRESVGAFLEKLGAQRAEPSGRQNNKARLSESTFEQENKSSSFVQGKFNF